MGNHRDSTEEVSSVAVTSLEASKEKFPDPGLPPHSPRLTDVDPKQNKKAERHVTLLFVISILGALLFWFAYFGIRVEGNFYDVTNPENNHLLRLQNLFLGLGIALSMFGIGIGIVHWARALMPDHEMVEMRHPVSSEESRAEAQDIMETIIDESGIKRRPLLRNTLIGSIILAPLTFVTLFRDLGPANPSLLKHTLWDQGVRLVRDPSGTPIKAADVTIGSAYHVLPENLQSLTHETGYIEEKAKAVVLLMRINPAELNISEDRKDWNVDGILAFSKVCTHVGCPIALYEQRTHHLLCPCHQSTFDAANECEVIFGPAAHPLPQLPIAVDEEGYLVAQSDFHEPVGPAYWERAKHVNEMAGEAN
ncbi:cytochrome bc1 complex Rieske iron-sulfur subunit [Rothia terrae]|uniref:cytochrome bc1 complex Rieske iron-sulfur subunit n=1 Tax=Rothia terrae TaxID=396015 RepID=UPI0028816193|nr:Rieske 2Fe-2S domain-containing protein [Rothia terrae]MDT0188792.1 Rieske 2Fe-2S domain-containing protein [Rothia terrae]